MDARLARPASAPADDRDDGAHERGVDGAQPVEGRHARDEAAARAQHAEHLREHGPQVVELLQRHARDGAVEGAVRDRAHALHVAPPVEHRQVVAGARDSLGDALGAHVDADHHPLRAGRAGRRPRGAPGPAPEVDHLLAGHHRRPGDDRVVDVHAAVAGKHGERVLGRRGVEGVDRPVEARGERAGQGGPGGDQLPDLPEDLLRALLDRRRRRRWGVAVGGHLPGIVSPGGPGGRAGRAHGA
jgi:hypothetical protein